jgi:hypothetical protein
MDHNKDHLRRISISIIGDIAAALNQNEISYDSSSWPADFRRNLRCCGRFFESELKTCDLYPYYLVLAAASYYLSDLPGLAFLLTQSNSTDDLENMLNRLFSDKNMYLVDDLQYLLLGLLNIDLHRALTYDDDLKNDLLNLATKIRTTVYRSGTPRELLLGDITAAILKKTCAIS